MVVLDADSGLHQLVGGELDAKLRLYISRQETMFVATYDERGERDCTFRVGPPGFVRVLDVNRVAWTEYQGDANLGCVAEFPEVSLLFVDASGTSIGLRLDGQAKILDDRSMRRAYRNLPEPVHDEQPEHWVTVFVEDVYVA